MIAYSESTVITNGINALSFDSLFSAMPTKYPIKYINAFTPITGLKILSCNKPIINPITLRVFLHLNKAINNIIIRLVFGNMPNILK